MTIDSLKKVILSIANKYPIKKVFLFGSRAEETDHENSKIVCYDAKPLLRKEVFSALR